MESVCVCVVGGDGGECGEDDCDNGGAGDCGEFDDGGI